MIKIAIALIERSDIVFRHFGMRMKRAFSFFNQGFITGGIPMICSNNLCKYGQAVVANEDVRTLYGSALLAP